MRKCLLRCSDEWTKEILFCFNTFKLIGHRSGCWPPVNYRLQAYVHLCANNFIPQPLSSPYLPLEDTILHTTSSILSTCIVIHTVKCHVHLYTKYHVLSVSVRCVFSYTCTAFVTCCSLTFLLCPYSTNNPKLSFSIFPITLSCQLLLSYCTHTCQPFVCCEERRWWSEPHWSVSGGRVAVSSCLSPAESLETTGHHSHPVPSPTPDKLIQKILSKVSIVYYCEISMLLWCIKLCAHCSHMFIKVQWATTISFFVALDKS